MIRLLPIGIILFSSCSYAATGVRTSLGNYAYSQGNYQKAIYYYISALETNPESGYIMYNIGNVYAALGEEEAALVIWDKGEAHGTKEVRRRIYFNRGYLFYKLGRYKEAELDYIKVLKLRPNDKDAQVNLELCLQKNSLVTDGFGVPPTPPALNEEGLSGEADRLLDYLKRKEALYWRTQETAKDSFIEDW